MEQAAILQFFNFIRFKDQSTLFYSCEGDFSKSLEIRFHTIRQVVKCLTDEVSSTLILLIIAGVLEIEHLNGDAVNVSEFRGKNRGYIILIRL